MLKTLKSYFLEHPVHWKNAGTRLELYKISIYANSIFVICWRIVFEWNMY